MEKPQNIPVSPGVYLYKDKGGRIIYVGKARHLKKRVLSYFRPPEQLTIKTRAMMSHAVSIEFLTTSTEKEALLLEASLIKKHRPHYNIVLRDDKQYILFRIDKKVQYPRLEVVRKMKKDNAYYFGPFTSSQAAKETWKTIHAMFPLRRCKDKAMKNRMRPCLYHHIGLCLAPCTEEIKEGVYAEMIQRVNMFLSGKSRELIDTITKNMVEASDNLDFEKAALLRDQRLAIEKTVERQGVVLANTIDMDVIGLVSRGDGLALAVIFVRGGAVIDKATFFWANLILEDAEELLMSFLTQFYTQDKDIPPRIVLPWALHQTDSNLQENPALIAALESNTVETRIAQEIDENNDTPFDLENVAAMLSEWRGSHVRILAARTKEDQQLVDMAKANAKEASYRRSDLGMDERLAAIFHTNEAIRKVECVDVSHTSGIETKVGMVVYQDGKPHKSEYRVWNIEGAGGDDYAALSIWAKRRAEHGAPWPHLMLIDGGRGQVNAVHKVFNEYFSTPQENSHSNENFLPTQQKNSHNGQNATTPHAQNNSRDKQSFNLHEGQLPFLLAGIAKARDENGHADRRAGNLADRIFLPHRSNPLPLREGSAELLFLQSVRDATHDFAIGKHRQARAKRTLDAELLRLPNIGQHTAKLLWDNFKDLDNMRNANVKDLEAIDGIGNKKATKIWESLQKL